MRHPLQGVYPDAPGLAPAQDRSIAVLEGSMLFSRRKFNALASLAADRDPRSELARSIAPKGYHAESVGVYTTR